MTRYNAGQQPGSALSPTLLTRFQKAAVKLFWAAPGQKPQLPADLFVCHLIIAHFLMQALLQLTAQNLLRHLKRNGQQCAM